MRWFLRDKKVYIGPVTELQMELLQNTKPILANSGVACLADPQGVDLYVTVPTESINLTDLESIRLGILA